MAPRTRRRKIKILTIKSKDLPPQMTILKTVIPQKLKLDLHVSQYKTYISDILALAASISELSSLTRRARTANWCALQMADKNNPALENLGITVHPQDKFYTYSFAGSSQARLEKNSQAAQKTSSK